MERVFEEFKRGVYKVLDKRVVGFFAPQELMEVANGHLNYDWDEFEKVGEWCSCHFGQNHSVLSLPSFTHTSFPSFSRIPPTGENIIWYTLP